MTTIDQEHLKKIQLEVLDAFHRFCEENGFVYSISCGTLLGAVRHGGYIPWDDDIDICMLREEYDRLMSSFPSVYEDRYKIGEISRDAAWDHPYAKMYDINTVMLENRVDSVETGISIDIFPIDRIPESPRKRKIHKRRCSLLYRMFIAKDRSLKADRALWKTLALIPLKALLLPWSRQTMCRRIDSELKRWNGTGSHRLADLDMDFNLSREFDVSLFDSISTVSFEGHQYKAFADAGSYLTALYGDYMQLPPVSQRVSHHKFKAYYKD